MVTRYPESGLSTRVPCDVAKVMSRNVAVFIVVLAMNFMHWQRKKKFLMQPGMSFALQDDREKFNTFTIVLT